MAAIPGYTTVPADARRAEAPFAAAVARQAVHLEGRQRADAEEHVRQQADQRRGDHDPRGHAGRVAQALLALEHGAPANVGAPRETSAP